ncbi:MAG: NAD-dependent epimerase/dehydratase family protein [Proteobacteria bacterium]|nr:NAD-dependent epimerase/dehydratase family protein [Pseudomonadota bacterium]
MRILITGAGGQIGHDLIGALVAEGHELVSTDLAPRPPSHAHAGGDWQRLDVTDAAAVQHLFTECRPELVFHLAAILSASGEANPRLAYDVNQTGTWNVLEACRRARVNRLMFTSSIAVFGPPPSGPLPDPAPDDSPLHPGTMYGVTKVAGELLCAYYRKRYDIDCRGVRFPGLISAAMPGGGSSDYALFMYVDGVRKNGYEAFARADTRIPLMYMPDGVRALLELAMADRSKLTRTIYNIAAFSPRADEIATSVGRLLPDAKFTYKPDTIRQGILDSWPKAIDDAAARRDWGWKERFDLDGMTDDLVPRIRRMLELGAILSSH